MEGDGLVFPITTSCGSNPGMPPSVLVWDLETVPDLRAVAAAQGLVGKSDDEVRAALGDKFPSRSTTQSSASALWSLSGRRIIGS